MRVTSDELTLRDWFAGQVIASCQIVVDPGRPEPTVAEVKATADRYARSAYLIADAMLIARHNYWGPVDDQTVPPLAPDGR